MRHCKTKPKDIIIQCFTHSEQLPEAWNNFLPKDHYLQPDQLSISEKAALPDISYLYVLITHKDKPKVAASFQLLDFKAKHLNKEQVKLYIYTVWKLFTKLARPNLLIAGHLFRHDVASCYFENGLTDYESFMYYRDAIEEAIDVSSANAILVKDMPLNLVQYFRNYEPQYFILRNDISMEMEIPNQWASMRDYEKELKHKYKQRYKKLRQPWEGIDIKELSVEEVKDNKTELYKLYNNVSDNQQIRIGFLNEDFLWMLKAYCKENLRVWAVYEGEKMIAFFSAWVKQDAFDMFYIGIDYERNNELNTYFNILFFSVEQAINFKKSKLILGRTALDAKARIGCKPRYLSTYLYIRNSLVRRYVARALKNTSDLEGEWENRHPFKKSQEH